jgi:hypothetical protein
MYVAFPLRARAQPLFLFKPYCPLVVRLFLGVGRPHSPENACLGRVVSSLLPIAHHLLRLRVPRYLAAPYFYAGTRRWLGRYRTLGQNRSPCCCGHRHPVDQPAPVCCTRLQGEKILFPYWSSRVSPSPLCRILRKLSIRNRQHPFGL